ncbi:MAG TPA: hypothetical protein EYO84_09655 [Planctomycetes bacterium]|nr:hypothetical protein [Planctomycetota bacterium]
MKPGDLVQWRNERIGIVVSEIFDMRPTWKDEHPAVMVWTQHGHPPYNQGKWMWLLEDIEVLSEAG